MEEGAHIDLGSLLFSGSVLLGAALAFVLLFRRLGLGAVLGYLLAGMLVGPHGFGFIGNPETILSFAEIGIVLLLFLVGLELAPSRLWKLKGDIFVLGPLQVLLCGLAMFGLTQVFTGLSWEAAIAIGLPLGLSSTAQVLPLLQSRGRLKTVYGEKSFSILLFQDLSLIPLLTVVAALSRAPIAEGAPAGWELVLRALAAVAGLVLVGRYLLSPLLKFVGKVAERELFIVIGLFTVCASAALMESLGLSAALGAFVAGVMLAESPYRHELEADVDPFRSILLGLFFLAVGMMLDTGLILDRPIFVIGMALLLVMVKVVIITGLGRLFGLRKYDALAMGLLLSQGGEFAFVLFTAARQSLLIETPAVTLFSAVVTLSMATTPFLMILARRLVRDSRNVDADLIDPDAADQASIIVVGHGRFGQTTSQIMQGAGYSVTLIDVKPEQIDLSGEFGRKVFYGDGTRIDLLRRAGADEAQAILFCMDDTAFDAEALEPVRTTFPNAEIFVRAYDRRHSLALQDAEGVHITRELFESAINMARETLEVLGDEAESIAEVIEEYRRLDRERMKAQRESGDMHAAKHLSFGGPDSDRTGPTGKPAEES